MNPEHLAVVKQGAAAIAEWRAENPDITLNLKEADLNGADLNGADLSEADLSGAHLIEAALSGADLSGTNLSGAHLKWADLDGARLIGTDLSGADLNRTSLIVAHLKWVGLTEADFTEAICNLTTFSNVDLSTAKGLETVQHRGPSTLGVDTLYLSGGKIPDVFLLGCGLPEEFITYLPSLLGAQQAIQFYSCFISYSHKDEEFAKRLHGRLREAGLRVWYAPEEMKGGRKLHEQIDEGIRLHDKLLLVLSEESLKSEWVATEIRKARKAERKEGRQKLFPIRLVPFDPHIKEWECFDADSGKDLGVELREYFIPDFEQWKHQDAFEPVMVRLLNDLRAESKEQPSP